jgi:hypothetical protein
VERRCSPWTEKATKKLRSCGTKCKSSSQSRGTGSHCRGATPRNRVGLGQGALNLGECSLSRCYCRSAQSRFSNLSTLFVLLRGVLHVVFRRARSKVGCRVQSPPTRSKRTRRVRAHCAPRRIQDAFPMSFCRADRVGGEEQIHQKELVHAKARAGLKRMLVNDCAADEAWPKAWRLRYIGSPWSWSKGASMPWPLPISMAPAD